MQKGAELGTAFFPICRIPTDRISLVIISRPTCRPIASIRQRPGCRLQVSHHRRHLKHPLASGHLRWRWLNVLPTQIAFHHSERLRQIESNLATSRDGISNTGFPGTTRNPPAPSLVSEAVSRMGTGTGAALRVDAGKGEVTGRTVSI